MLFALLLLVLLSTNCRVESSAVDLSLTQGDGPIQAWENLEALIKTSSEFEDDWHSEASIVPSYQIGEYQPIHWFQEVPQQALVKPKQSQQQASMALQQGPQLPLGPRGPQQQLLSVGQTPDQQILVPRAHGTPQPLNLPLFTRIMFPIPRGLFKPEGGISPLPDAVRQMLLPPAPVKPTPPQYGAVDALCHLDRMYVRIKKGVFVNPSEAWRYLKVGTCPVNEDTAEHYYFLYYLKGCGLKYEEKDNYSVYSNTLTYNPPSTEPVLRELPFSVDVLCKYYKHFNAYAIGYHPVMKSGTVFARLSQASHITLRQYDDNWKPLMSSHIFTIGNPMYFEAKVPSTKAGERIYINKCFVTPTSSPESTVKYVVIENNGCLVDGKKTGSSKFIPFAEKTAMRFSIVAFVFKDSTPLPTGERVLYLHCEITVGPETPNPSAKSCSYDQATKKWNELRGDSSVCSCCDTVCTSPEPKAPRMMVSSDAWKLTKDAVPSEPRVKAADIPDLVEADDLTDGFEKYWSDF